ncbi:MAG: RDD family protein [Planctomycetota bacterium]|jgi:uncharacterized RDD family membrane protein YckC
MSATAPTIDLGPLPPQIVRSPEGLLLQFRTATAGERMAAFAIDVVIVILLLLAAVLPGTLFAFMGATVMGPLLLLWFFLLRFGWFSWAEIRGGGRTPGKRRYHLRVVRSDGGPLTAEILLARNLTREVETFLPTMLVLNPDMLFSGHDGLVRLLAMVWVIVLLLFPLTNAARMRVGDLLAGTRVVVSPPAMLARDLAAATPTPTSAAKAQADADAADEFVFTPDQLGVYGERELAVLEDVLRKAPASGKDEALLAVTRSICKRLGLGDPTAALARPLAFLRAFYAAQRQHLEQRLLLGKRRLDKHDGKGKPSR